MLTCRLAVAISTKAASLRSPGDSLLVSRSLHCFSFSASVGSSPNHPVGLSKLAVRKKVVISLDASEVRLAQTLEKRRQNSRMSATLLSLNAKPPHDNRTSPCSLALALESFTLVAGSSSSFGFKSCKNGLALLV